MTLRIPRTEHIRFLLVVFLFFALGYLVFGSVLQIKLTYVSF